MQKASTEQTIPKFPTSPEDSLSSDKLFRTATEMFLGDLVQLVRPTLAATLDFDEARLGLSENEEQRFASELGREANMEVRQMVVTWKEALAEREAIGEARGAVREAHRAILLLAKRRQYWASDELDQLVAKLETLDDLDHLHRILEHIVEAGSLAELDQLGVL